MASLDSNPDMRTEPVREIYRAKYAKLAKTSRQAPFLSYSILASFAIFARDTIFSHAGRGQPYGQSSLLASSAPSTSALSFAHWIDGCTLALKGPWEKPQSVPASTFYRPTSPANRTMRCATSSACSIKLVAWVTTPGMSTDPSGGLTSCHTFHSCSCRTFAASNR